jgi:excisionase family DNA binding protein
MELDPMIPTEKIALDIDSAAKAISVSPWTIRKWISTGKLAATRLGRRVCVTPEALRKLVDQGTRQNGTGKIKPR